MEYLWYNYINRGGYMKILSNIKEKISEISKRYEADNLVLGTVQYYAGFIGEGFKNINETEVYEGEKILKVDIASKGEDENFTSVLTDTVYVQDVKLARSKSEAGKTVNLLWDDKPLTEVFPKMKGKKVSVKAIRKALDICKKELVENKGKNKNGIPSLI